MDCLLTFQLIRPAGVHLFASQEQTRVLRPLHRFYVPGSHTRLVIASHSLTRTPFVKSAWCSQLWNQLGIPSTVIPKINPQITLHAVSISCQLKEMVEAVWKIVAPLFIGACKEIKANHLCLQCTPAVGLIVFAMWGLGPLSCFFRQVLLKKDNRNWKKSQTRFIVASYLRPLLLWIAMITICRAFDPVVLSSESSQIIKQRVVNFVRSLSTVLAFAYCAASLTQQLQKFVMEREDVQDSRNLGVQFIGSAVYSAVWVAAACLFMELLGFSTQKWLTAGGLGTLLLTLAGREIFTNFLSSIMIHATRPFVENEWIQTKIEGYEVSGTVEHVGWWSPTIIRGDDREAVHIPNHKFTVNVVRNLSQKTHWRIKTHLGISHLDASKIPNIVSDMRKVLAKHPQVEQKRLHRRVFFDNIDPENQALLILVSCFVKTSHFEEYLNVKEIILLDLIKVINHHHARLATPIRSFQRLLDDESRQTSFRDKETHGRPFLLIEASSTASGHGDVEKFSNDNGGLSHRMEANVIGSSASEHLENEGTARSSISEVKGMSKQKDPTVVEIASKKGSSSFDAAPPAPMKPQLEGLDSMGLNSKDITLLGAAFEKPPANIPDSSEESELTEKSTLKSTVEPVFQDPGLRSQKVEKGSSKSSLETDVVSLREIDAKGDANSVGLPVQRLDCDLWADEKGPSSSSSCSKQEKDRSSLGASATVRPQLEENLVLGVALDGRKRTLPLDNDVITSGEQKKLVTSVNGNGGTSIKGRRDGPHISGPSDTRDKEQ